MSDENNVKISIKLANATRVLMKSAKKAGATREKKLRVEVDAAAWAEVEHYAKFLDEFGGDGT